MVAALPRALNTFLLFLENVDDFRNSESGPRTKRKRQVSDAAQIQLTGAEMRELGRLEKLVRAREPKIGQVAAAEFFEHGF
jgi:hypothetical protein